MFLKNAPALCCSLVAAIVCLAPQAVAGKPAAPPSFPPMPIRYLVTWLDAPLSGWNSWATMSNTAGTVVGRQEDVNGETRACVWTAAGAFDLNDVAPVPSGWTLIGARAINEFGQIAGTAENQATGQVRPYRYDPPSDTAPAAVALIGDPTSSVSFHNDYMRPLNNLGDVSYQATLADGKSYHYVQAMDGTLFQRQGYGMNAMNDRRQLVGGNLRWNATTGQIETFSTSITAADINVHGTFVGRITSGRNYKAMRYTTSAQAIGPTSSFAFGINSSNDVVGDVGDTGVGFIFTDTYGYVDLDTVVTGDTATLAAWNSSINIEPVKITDRGANGFGVITGTAFFSGSTNRAFVLTPVSK
jgi:hypothetical protein